MSSVTAIPATTTGYEEIPLSGKRRVIARRLTEAKRDAPHFRVSVDVRIDNLLKLRQQLNANAGERRVSINDMLVKAVAMTLTEVPEVNVQFDGEVLRQYVDADIAVAVALDDGLITPIVRRANKKGLAEISSETADFISRAKSGGLRPDEIEGGTFTVSNLGMFGVSSFDAIINPPQVAILAVGTTEKKRVFVGDEEIVAMVMSATLSCDHRIVDGALGHGLCSFSNRLLSSRVDCRPETGLSAALHISGAFNHMSKPPKFSLHHCALSVSDLDRSIEFYGRVLGFKVDTRTTSHDGKMDIVHVRNGDSYLE